MTYKNNYHLHILSSLLLIFTVIVSCKKERNDPLEQESVIQALTASELLIEESTVKLNDNVPRIIQNYSFDEDMNMIFLVLNANNTEWIGFSISDQAIDGKTIKAQLSYNKGSHEIFLKFYLNKKNSQKRFF